MNTIFDIIIFGFLLLDVPLIIWIITKRKEKLPHWFTKVFLAGMITAWLVIFYGSFIEPRRIVVHSETIQLSDETEKTARFALLSDIHVGPYKGESFVENAVEKLLEQDPEFVLIAGDFIFKNADKIDELNPLEQLSSEIPTYAVLGNHDYDLYSEEAPVDSKLGNQVRVKLTQLGIKVLMNEGIILRDQNIWLAGTDDLWTKASRLENALESRTTQSTTILLSHNPDILRRLPADPQIDLIVSGHTHGGQIRLPYLGPIGKIPTQLGQDFDQGLFDLGHTKLFITSGLGESGPRARLFNPPEIVMVELQY
jgi:predicted MPP superfamily phosphohydrolase